MIIKIFSQFYITPKTFSSLWPETSLTTRSGIICMRLFATCDFGAVWVLSISKNGTVSSYFRPLYFRVTETGSKTLQLLPGFLGGRLIFDCLLSAGKKFHHHIFEVFVGTIAHQKIKISECFKMILLLIP
ncbi:MAG: hypothetical protein R2764_00700 [Bacteroidales bacterium]